MTSKSLWLFTFALTSSLAAASQNAVGFAEVNSSIWSFASAWQLPGGKSQLSVCRSSSSAQPTSVVFALFQLQPLVQGSVDAAIQNATRAANEFSSTLVQRESVQDGDEIAFETAKTKLYRVSLDEDEDEDTSSQDQGCVETTVALPASGLYLVVATEPASSVHFTIRTRSSSSDEAPAEPVVQCFLGCGDEVRATKSADESLEAVHIVRQSNDITSAICASLLVSLTSLGGVVVLRVYTKSSQLVEYMTTFAAGCLLGVVVFHLLPEGSEKLSGGGDDSSPDWIPGAYTLLGVLLSLAIEVQVHVWLGGGDDEPCLETGASHHHGHGHNHGHSHGHRHKRLPDAQDLLAHSPSASSSVDSLATLSPSPTPTNSNEEPTVMSEHSTKIDSLEAATLPHTQETKGDFPTTTWWRRIQPIAWMTAIGDFCHAFTDGVVLAVAFQSCSASLGWAVALGIVLHEVPHRIGDFFVFLRAGMTLHQALIVNLLASSGSLAGVLAIFSLGDVSETTLGAMLAVGAGSLVFIALAELLPPVLGLNDQKDALCHLGWFTFGCALIWLSALREVECEA